MEKNIIFGSMKESFLMLWRNKALFSALFLMQALFFILLLGVSFVYQSRIVGNAMAITEYLSRQNLDESSVASSMLREKSILGDDPLIISRNFSEIVRNFRIYVAIVFVILTGFACLAWPVTCRIVSKNKNFLKNFFSILAVSLFYLGLIFGFFLYLLHFSFIEIAADGQKMILRYSLFALVSIVLLYFMLISMPLAAKSGLYKIAEKTLRIGIRKAHYVMASYLVWGFMLLVSAALFYYFFEKSLVLVMASILLMIFSFVFQRILIANMIRKLDA